MKQRNPARPVSGLAFLLMGSTLAVSTKACADDADMFLGIAHYHRVGPYRTSSSNSLEPTGDYQGERILIRGDTVGVRLAKHDSLSFNLIAQQDLLAYKPGDAASAALRGLNKRREGVNAGLELAWTPTVDDAVYLSETHDVLGQSKAWQTGIEYDHTFALPVTYTQIIPNIAYARYGASYARYYFGVSGTESLRTGLAAYSPAATSRTDVGLTVVQPFSKDIAMFVDYTHKRYGSVGASPMVNRASYFEVNVGLVYNFKRFF